MTSEQRGVRALARMAEGSLVDGLVARERWFLDPDPSFDAESLLAADAVEIGASGRRWDRAGLLELLEARRGVGVGPYEMDEIACRSVGDTARLLTYSLRTARGRTLRSSVWDVIDGRWQLVFHQGTLAPPATEENP